MIGFYTIALIYTVVRWQYLKKNKGIDIFENMRKPYEPWVKREKELAEIAIDSRGKNVTS